MTRDAAIQAEAARLVALFRAGGAQEVTTDILQPADTLLDLYGEDIRARAYVTSDPVLGEQMMRPDFTVPVVQAHMQSGADPARYTYHGRVFRKQDAGSGRAREYAQVGYEVFDGSDPAGADAEVLNLFLEALKGRDLTLVTGDIGLLIAAVGGLSTSSGRRNALLRHIWRPTRFRALLDRFSGIGARPQGRDEMIAQLAETSADQMIATAGPQIGMRGANEVRARLERLAGDADVAPIPETERRAIIALLDLDTDLASAPSALREIAKDYPALKEAVDRFAARARLLPSDARFQGAYGRALMEYYDGFVFGITLPGQALPVATGGRYDALTRVLGQGREIPAVGGVIRPDLVEGGA
jgi:ATP phosphoribosyltransferase regulatory subunit